MRSKKALYNIVSGIVLQVVIIVSGFIIPKTIIDSFGSDTNGLVSSITQFLAYITLLESGFGPVIKATLYRPIARKDSKTICSILKTSEKFFRTIALVFLGYIVILCIVYPQIVTTNFEWSFTASLIAIIGISTFAEYFFGMTYTLFLQAKQTKYIISTIKIVTYILSTASVVVLAKTGASIHIIKLISGTIFVIRPLILNLYVKKKFKININEGSNNYSLDKKWDGLAQHLAYVIHTKTDITLLTIFTTLSEVSVYSIYSLVVNGIKAIISIISGSIDATFGDIIAKNEKKNLNIKYSMFESLYNTISTIAFTSTIVLITPFISVYMKGVSDADYIRPLFGILLVISEYIWAIRQPYNVIVLAAGHFRETKKGAWLECITNIVVSILLVGKLGIVGVAIGTIVAMTIRTIELIYHANKYILERPMRNSAKKILIIIVETSIAIIVSQLMPFKENTNYLNWGINAIMVGLATTAITLGLNLIFLKEDLKNAKHLFKVIFKRRKQEKPNQQS